MQIYLTPQTLDHLSVLCKMPYANNIKHCKEAKAEESGIELSRFVGG